MVALASIAQSFRLTPAPRRSWCALAWRRGALSALLILLGLSISVPVSAEWRTTRQVTIGTAQVLEQGELTFGIIGMPVAYGLSSKLTIQTHPILDLLLVPNVGARYKVWDGASTIVALTGDYRQSFFFRSAAATIVANTADGRPCNRANASGFGSQIDARPEAACVVAAPGPPGELTMGLVGTWYLSKKWALSAAPLFAARLGGQQNVTTDATDTSDFHGGAALSLEAHVLLQAQDLIVATTFFRYEIDGGMDRPLASVVWVHQFRRWLDGVHLAAGLSFGRFQLGEVVAGESAVELPVFPVLDLWWRR